MTDRVIGLISAAFYTNSLGLTWVQSIISFGGVVGLATTLLIGLYAQARIYLVSPYTLPIYISIGPHP